MNELSYPDVLVFSGTLVLAYLVVQRFSSYRKGDGRRRRRYAPSVGCLPIFGSVPYLPNFRVLHEWCLNKSRTLGDVFSFKVGSTYTVILTSHDTIREAFIQRSGATMDRVVHFSNRVMNPNAKGIVLHPYNEAFKKYHQLTLSIMKEFGFGSNTMEARIHMEIEQVIQSIVEQNEKSFDPQELIKAAVHSIIHSILFGRPMDHSNKRDSDFLILIEKTHSDFMNLLALDVVPFFSHLPYYRKRLDEARSSNESSLSAIDQKIEECLSGGSAESFVSSFVKKEGEHFDKEQLQYTIRDFVGAGSGTTSASVLFAIALLANNPAVQERVQKEIDSVVSSDRSPSYDDMKKMPYVEATILELMRYKTIVPLGLSHLTTHDTEVGGYFIPKDSMVFSILYAAHMDEKIWGDPTVFRPERFLDADGNIINRDLVIPFSLGKRSCLGEVMARQEVFQFITSLLQKFNIRPPHGSERIVFMEEMHMVVFPSCYKARFLLRKIIEE